MSHACARTNGGESAPRPSQHNPTRPFAVIQFGDDWDLISHEPGCCRRVASARNQSADLLDTFREPAPGPYPEAEAEMEPGP
jgi:hypothetical protein